MGNIKTCQYTCILGSVTRNITCSLHEASQLPDIAPPPVKQRLFKQTLGHVLYRSVLFLVVRLLFLTLTN